MKVPLSQLAAQPHETPATTATPAATATANQTSMSVSSRILRSDGREAEREFAIRGAGGQR